MAEHYGEVPPEEEVLSKSLVPIETRLTMIDVDGAAAAYEAYLELCRRILDESDYATIRGIKARKRSGWAKLRRFYGITTMITEQQRTPRFSEWEPGQAFVYRFTVTGRLGDRVEEADGACESTELEYEGNNIAPTEHNVRAKALTRAKNRVTADLIGGGEVSAEELNEAVPVKTKKAPRPRKRKKQPDNNFQAKIKILYNKANTVLREEGLEPFYKTSVQVEEALVTEGGLSQKQVLATGDESLLNLLVKHAREATE